MKHLLFNSSRGHTIEIGGRTVLAEIVTLDEEHNQSIELLMSIHDAQQVPWVSLCKNLLDVEVNKRGVKE
jgi:hypothetical protein